MDLTLSLMPMSERVHLTSQWEIHSNRLPHSIVQIKVIQSHQQVPLDWDDHREILVKQILDRAGTGNPQKSEAQEDKQKWACLELALHDMILCVIQVAAGLIGKRWLIKIRECYQTLEDIAKAPLWVLAFNRWVEWLVLLASSEIVSLVEATPTQVSLASPIMTQMRPSPVLDLGVMRLKALLLEWIRILMRLQLVWVWEVFDKLAQEIQQEGQLWSKIRTNRTIDHQCMCPLKEIQMFQVEQVV